MTQVTLFDKGDRVRVKSAEKYGIQDRVYIVSSVDPEDNCRVRLKDIGKPYTRIYFMWFELTPA